MAARCSSSSPVPTARREQAGRRTCRAPARATTAGRSRRSSRPTTAISTPWTGCCSARRGSTVTALDSGRTFHGGALDEALIDRVLRLCRRPRIAIFVDEPDWHTRRLKRAFAAARRRGRAAVAAQAAASRSAAAVTASAARLRDAPARRRVRAHDRRRQLRAGDHAAGRAACAARTRRARATTTPAPSSAASTNR